MCKIAVPDCFYFEDMSPLPERRSYRTHMRRVSAGRTSARHRVAINRFWNEMEEFYDRHEERKARESNNTRLIKGLRGMPAYTTDVWDHEREEAENRLNESMVEEEVEKKFRPAKRNDTNLTIRARLESSDVMLEDSDDEQDQDCVSICSSSSSGSFSLSFNNVWDKEESAMPSPPSKLPDLRNFILF